VDAKEEGREGRRDGEKGVGERDRLHPRGHSHGFARTHECVRADAIEGGSQRCLS
jgi:hypothetical protein